MSSLRCLCNNACSDDLLAFATFDFDGSKAFVLNVTLPDNIPVGKELTINNGTVQIQNAEPHFDLRVDMTVDLHDLKPLSFGGTIIETDKYLEIQGDEVKQYTMDVAKKGIVAEGVVFTGKTELDGSGFSGVIEGIAELVKVDFAVKASFPTPNGIEFQLSLGNDVDLPSLSLNDLVQAIDEIEVSCWCINLELITVLGLAIIRRHCHSHRLRHSTHCLHRARLARHCR